MALSLTVTMTAGPLLVCSVSVMDATPAPIPGATVYITTDAAGTKVVTDTNPCDANGAAHFNLAAGTYYAWVAAPGYAVTNPTTFNVS